MTRDDRLPRDAQSILELAARSMFDLFANASEGMLLVDRHARVVWINDQYRRFLPALGFDREEDFVGQPVSNVVHNTQMHRVLETGKPILIDLLTNRAGTFVVTRIPLRDEAGDVLGVLGIVLFDHPETTLQPLITKFARLEQDLHDARRELAHQRRSKYTFASFVGTSAAAVEVKRQARRAALSSSPVLLLGETGTGKELLAHAIHAASPRAGRPFVSVNMAAVPETLLEAEFFGVAPGAYTGADKKGRDGKFKLADGGTLFLDEIGDMPPSLQTRLLRVLAEGEFFRVGGRELIRVDVRVIAATHQPLDALVAEGRFRADLLHRLDVVRLRMPPLRERRDDVPLLATRFLAAAAQRLGAPAKRFAKTALERLRAHDWPGNVRELENLCWRLAALAPGDTITVDDLDAALAPGATATSAPGDWEAALATWARERLAAGERSLHADARARFDQVLLEAALAQTHGHRSEAAALLGLGRNTLTRKLGPGRPPRR